MNETIGTSPAQPGTFGNNHVQRFLWNTPLGGFYEVSVGSTRHEYGLLAINPTLGITLERVREELAPSFAATNPCLAKPYACGEDDGYVWIRFELTDAVLLALFTGGARPLEEDEDAERVEDAEELRKALGGRVPQTVLWPIVGDLLEGLVCLHASGGLLGDVGPSDIGFVENIRSIGAAAVARWTNYGLLALRDPAKAATWTQVSDVRVVGDITRTLLCGASDAALPTSAWPEWKDFFAAAEAPDATAATLAAAYAKLLSAHHLNRSARVRPEDTIPARRPAPRKIRPKKKRSLSWRNQRDSSGEVQTGGRVFAISVAIVAVVGIIGATLYPYIQRMFPKNQAVPEEEVVEDGKPTTLDPNAIWYMSAAELEELADNTEREDALPARIRYAFLLARGAEGVEANPERANALASEVLAAMEARATGINVALDRACDFWRGYALLVGVGVEPDSAQAMLLLEQCADSYSDPRAMALLGDYYASGAEDDISPANDKTAVQRWVGAINAQPPSATRWFPYVTECADKIAGLFFAGRGIPDRDQDRYIAALERAAAQKHLPSILALGHAYLDGRGVKADAPTAKNWFAKASQMGSAFGMYHRARMIEMGLASNPSITSALVWYKRAAKGDCPASMQAIARLLREGNVRADSGEVLDTVDGLTADEWEAKAEATPLPDPLPRTTWWLGAQTDRFPEPEPGRIR